MPLEVCKTTLTLYALVTYFNFAQFIFSRIICVGISLQICFLLVLSFLWHEVSGSWEVDYWEFLKGRSHSRDVCVRFHKYCRRLLSPQALRAGPSLLTAAGPICGCWGTQEVSLSCLASVHDVLLSNSQSLHTLLSSSCCSSPPETCVHNHVGWELLLFISWAPLLDSCPVWAAEVPRKSRSASPLCCSSPDLLKPRRGMPCNPDLVVL